MQHVAAFYRFAPLDASEALRAALENGAAAADLRGTILLASEGVNGTIAGKEAGLRQVIAALHALPGFADMPVRWSTASEPPFRRLRIRLRPELVPLGRPVDARDTGTHIPPRAWNALLTEPDTVVIDTRNDYETEIGSFPGAIMPGTQGFRDFPAWWNAHRAELAGKRIAMFCTGGIRCEKASAFLLAEGVAEVRQLSGGILAYLAEIPEDESRWEGECFVFDGRTALGPGLAEGSHEPCHACGRAVSPEARQSPAYREGISCPACIDEYTDADRARFAERQRQTVAG